MFRFAAAAAIVATAVALTGGTASAQRSAGHGIFGVVHAKGHGNGLAAAASGIGKLRYHNGPAMTTNKTYAIYWVPPGYTTSAGYTTLINRFLADVAADSGKTSNVYYSDTQYYSVSGGVQTKIKYSSTFGGSWTDTAAFPASGCSDTVSQTTVCLSDAQLQAEVQKARSANGWPSGNGALYLLFTPKNVGSCAGSSCAFSDYCAYHSWIGSGSTAVLYANQPYTDTVPSACDAAPHPNGDAADPTINVVSHEHNEAITDPQGNAWYDLAGYENGDKCAWNFGAQIGSTSYGQYNQLINGHPYELQQEYSNARSNCVLTGT